MNRTVDSMCAKKAGHLQENKKSYQLIWCVWNSKEVRKSCTNAKCKYFDLYNIKCELECKRTINIYLQVFDKRITTIIRSYIILKSHLNLWYCKLSFQGKFLKFKLNFSYFLRQSLKCIKPNKSRTSTCFFAHLFLSIAQLITRRPVHFHLIFE